MLSSALVVLFPLEHGDRNSISLSTEGSIAFSLKPKGMDSIGYLSNSPASRPFTCPPPPLQVLERVHGAYFRKRNRRSPRASPWT